MTLDRFNAEEHGGDPAMADALDRLGAEARRAADAGFEARLVEAALDAPNRPIPFRNATARPSGRRWLMSGALAAGILLAVGLTVIVVQGPALDPEPAPGPRILVSAAEREFDSLMELFDIADATMATGLEESLNELAREADWLDTELTDPWDGLDLFGDLAFSGSI